MRGKLLHVSIKAVLERRKHVVVAAVHNISPKILRLLQTPKEKKGKTTLKKDGSKRNKKQNFSCNFLSQKSSLPFAIASTADRHANVPLLSLSYSHYQPDTLEDTFGRHVTVWYFLLPPPYMSPKLLCG